MDVLTGTLIGAFVVWFVCIRHHGKGPKKYKIRRKGKYDLEYIPRTVKVPAVRGWKTSLVCKVANSYFGKMFLLDMMLQNGDFKIFRTIQMKMNPTFYPNIELTEPCAKPDDVSLTNEEMQEVLNGSVAKDGFNFNCAQDFVRQYKSGETTPTAVAENAIIAITNSEKLNAIVKYDIASIKKQAAASTDRYRTNTTLSPIDGVIIVVKDEFAVKGFPHTSGSSYRHPNEPAKADSGVVTKMRDLGCIVLAVVNMHEFGIGTSGNNPNKGFGACRTPYHLDHFSGGSSSGCASAVGAGIATMGIGTDGGGSIRIPSAYCGVVGLKPTFARVTLAGVDGLSYSVGHAGPICNCVRDVALFYALLSGPDPEYPLGLKQPKVKLPKFGGNLDGIKIGIDRRYFKDCSPDMFKICSDALPLLESSGATLETAEFAEITDICIAHRITILSEMSTNISSDFDNEFNAISVPSRTLFALGRSITAQDFIQANKQRTRAIEITEEFFKKYDALVTPTTGQTAPLIHSDELAVGATNPSQDGVNMRFVALGNFTGIPAITVPVGYNDKGLPVGFQIMCAWWREDIALQIAEYLERKIALQKPRIYNDILAA
nr:fatty acid amide hydrolase [Ciona intestinalis]|eukprot:XP_009858983.1 fatty acid amide hydrolase [Ciona intestinalis]